MRIAAMKANCQGQKADEISAIIDYVAKSNNMELSFPIIATINGQTLHNHYHGNLCSDNKLFLIDAGAETEMGYAGDMSSTIPVSGKFSEIQKIIYEIQTRMHFASVDALKPGVRFEDVYDLSAKVMVEDLKSLNLMKGEAVEDVKA